VLGHKSGIETKKLDTEVDNRIKNLHEKRRILCAFRKIRDVYNAATKKEVPVQKNKSAVIISKCVGASKKRCPDCNSWRVRIWSGCDGKTHLLCGACGWDSRNIPSSTWRKKMVRAGMRLVRNRKITTETRRKEK
jgi:hypothetical protein